MHLLKLTQGEIGDPRDNRGRSARQLLGEVWGHRV
jgi:hypothetical protein